MNTRPYWQFLAAMADVAAEPMATISLARSLEVSPLAVSQHLAAFAAAAWPTAPAGPRRALPDQ